MAYQRIVVKTGTSTLTGGSMHLSPPRMVDLARQLAALHTGGCEVILVTSGAMAAGREALGFPQLPRQIPAKQMLAAIGQPRLMNLYADLFGLYGVRVAQVLLTRADLRDRRRYLNARNTLLALLEQGILPVVNENDTVATDEIKVGDNDNLSGLVANLVEAELLLLLTDQPGMFTADPRRVPDAELIREVTTPEIPEALWRVAGGTRNGLGTGGMFTKLQAADLARRSGAAVAIARGSDPDIVLRLFNGEPVGTFFHPVSTAMESRKRFILMSGGRPAGSVTVDAGAARALRDGGSLLPVGITAVAGEFERGDTVTVCDVAGAELARGLTNYAKDHLALIAGRQSTEVEALLGFTYGDEVIHRNDMVLLT
jgi:glutamate 5-kinase